MTSLLCHRAARRAISLFVLQRFDTCRCGPVARDRIAPGSICFMTSLVCHQRRAARHYSVCLTEIRDVAQAERDKRRESSVREGRELTNRTHKGVLRAIQTEWLIEYLGHATLAKTRADARQSAA